MSFLFYQLISWSERRKTESSRSAQTHHTIKWTLLQEPLDVILLSGVLTLRWGTPAKYQLFVTAVHSALQMSDWGEETCDTSVRNSIRYLLPAAGTLHSHIYNSVEQTWQNLLKRKKNSFIGVLV